MPSLEFHQLDHRLEHLRVRHPARQRRLIASLAEIGQQTPVIVIKQENSYLVIDGHKRIAALRQLGRDTVDAVVWEMNEAEALLLDRSMRMSEPETALEQGWLLSEMEERLNYSIDELARRFDRSPSWVARRLALVETLPEAIQRQVREGKITAQIAMRYLVPVARVNASQCQQMADAFAKQPWTTRQAAQLYNAWREATPLGRERILASPELFLKTQQPAVAEEPTLTRDLEMIAAIAQRALKRLGEETLEAKQREQAQRKIQQALQSLEQIAGQIENTKESAHVEPIATHDHSGVALERKDQARNRPAAGIIAPERAQSTAVELGGRAPDSPSRESFGLPPTDPRVVAIVQEQPRASP